MMREGPSRSPDSPSRRRGAGLGPWSLVFVLLPAIANVARGQSRGDAAGLPGEPAFHHEILAAFQDVAAASDRADLVPYGRTPEGRPLVLLVIRGEGAPAAEETGSALAAFIADRGREGTTAPAPSRVLVWIGCTIHGDEASAGEAGIDLARFLTGGSEEARRILQAVTVVIDPCQNPDGRDRFVASVRSAATRDPLGDPGALEHTEPWPGGRTNHYLFDLNRDWFLLSQPESRARAAMLRRFRPLVLADLHEMGSGNSYFFAPGAEPLNPEVGAFQRKWLAAAGESLGRDFDARGRPFFTEEVFDVFYPGYGGSWPCFTGAVGMTLEQATSAGRVIDRRDGSVSSFGEGVAQHRDAAMALLRLVAARSAELLEDAGRHAAVEVRRGAETGTAFVVAPGRDAARTRRIGGTLALQGVVVETLREPVTSRRARRIAGGPEEGRTFPEGSLVLRPAQPARALLTALFEPDIALPEPFASEDGARVSRGERSRIYDVTAWCLPLLAGLDAWRVESEALPSGVLGPFADAPRDVARGTAATEVAALAGSEAPAGFAARLAAAGVAVRVATEPFQALDRTFDAGSLVLLRSRQAAGKEVVWPEAVARLASEHGVEIAGTTTFRTPAGPDLGSPAQRVLERPRIAVVARGPVSPTSFGGVWHLLEERAAVPFTPVDAGRLHDLELDRYNVLVLPDGDPEAYERGMPGSVLVTLREWVRRGGTLVLVKGAFAFAASAKDAGLTEAKVVAEPEGAPLSPIPGAIVRVDVERSHFAGFGLPETVFVQLRGSTVFEGPKSGTARVVARIAAGETVRAGGLLTKAAAERVAGRPLVIVERRGDGHVIGIAEDLTARAAQEGAERLFQNAIILGPSFAGR